MKQFAALAIASALVGCRAPRVQFGEQAVAHHADEYGAVHDRWTRQLHIRHGYDTAANAWVTLVTPDFRAAYQAKLAALRQLAPEARDRLAMDQKSDQDNYVEFVLLVETGRWEWNDFSAPRSMWTVSMSDDHGHHASGGEIQPLAVKAQVREALFPPATPFVRGWRVRFPREQFGEAQPDRPDARWIALTIAGALGSDQARWEAK